MQNIVNESDIKKLVSMDSQFLSIIEKYGNPPNWKREQGFVSLCKIILEQQISLASANAHFKKLNEYLSKFSPKEILKLSDEEMRNCQISRQKAMYLRALATAVIEESLKIEELGSLDENEIRMILTKIKGIGAWTANIYMMFCLQYKDIFPYGDIAVMNTVTKLYGIKSKEEIINLSKKWIPLRSLAAYFLWHYYLSNKENKKRCLTPASTL